MARKVKYATVKDVSRIKKKEEKMMKRRNRRDYTPAPS